MKMMKLCGEDAAVIPQTQTETARSGGEEGETWEEKIKHHKKELEDKERAENEVTSEEKEKSWELMRECILYLETNNKDWERRKRGREEE